MNIRLNFKQNDDGEDRAVLISVLNQSVSIHKHLGRNKWLVPKEDSFRRSAFNKRNDAILNAISDLLPGE